MNPNDDKYPSDALHVYARMPTVMNGIHTN